MMTADLGTTGIAMRSLSGRLVRFAFTAGIVSLFASGIAAARNLAAPYLGMTEAQIIACAGEPHSRFKSGAETKTLTYHYSGAGPVPVHAQEPKAEEKKIRGKGIEEHLQQIQEERGQELDLLGKPLLPEQQAREGDLRA